MYVLITTILAKPCVLLNEFDKTVLKSQNGKSCLISLRDQMLIILILFFLA